MSKSHRLSILDNLGGRSEVWQFGAKVKASPVVAIETEGLLFDVLFKSLSHETDVNTAERSHVQPADAHV